MPSPSDAPATAGPTATVAVTAEPTATPLPTPSTTPAPAPLVTPRIDPPKVTLIGAGFPVSGPSQKLVRTAPIENSDMQARFAVDEYLGRLNTYRKNAFDEGHLAKWSLRPPFLTVVTSSVRESATAGVEREFVLESLRIDAAYQKPWGVQALLDVTVTIRDKVLSGRASDELETGRLRLGGDRRMQVIDGWNYAQGRWWNGFPALSNDLVAQGLEHTIGWHLHSETWIPGMPPVTYFGPVETPFFKSRSAWLGSFDRSRVASRALESVTAQVTDFETLTELGDGFVNVRVRGTVIATDPAGTTTRTPFDRLVRLFQQSWGYPAAHLVVDEEASPGVWRSGGQIALKDIDQTFG